MQKCLAEGANALMISYWYLQMGT